MPKSRTDRKKSNFSRRAPTRDPKPTILIVCEGKNTEPSYFNGFKISSATVLTVGKGYNTLSLVRDAERLAKEGEYDHIWCVFDKDDFAPSDFDNAIAKAKTNGFGVAWSNQSFEYWILLHFEDHQGGELSRHDYHQKLEKALKPLGLVYDGNGSKLIGKEMFEKMIENDPQRGKKRTCIAIERAKRILEKHKGNPNSLKESATTVHELVAFLIQFFDPQFCS